MPQAATSPAPLTSPPSTQLDSAEAEVSRALLMLAHHRLRTSVLWTLFVGPLCALLMLPLFPAAPLAIWTGVLLAVGALRMGHWWWWRRQPAAAADARWRHAFVAGAVLAGLSWSLGPLLLLPAGSGETVLLLLSLLAVGAVGTTALSAQPAALLGYLLGALAPVIVHLLTHGGRTEALAAAALAASLLALLTAGRITGRATRALLHAELRLSQALAGNHAALAHAEAASQAKSRFLATMSHELRTPLNAVIGAAQLLRTDDGDVLQRHHLLDAIQRSGGNLLGLIEDILDLSRIEAGELRLDVQDFHLGDCIDAALATAALGAHAKGLQLACRIDPAVPQRCRGDASRLRQLLLNLVGNAVKFTPAGEVLLQVDPGDAPGELLLRVQDSGVGIAPAALAHIFEPFRQGDEGTGRRFGGSGLGLSIVAQLVRAMGGRIGVDSQPGAGACFSLWLPLPASDGEAQTTPPPTASSARPVAYIEPHAASAAGLDALLRRLGCAPTACASGAALRAWCIAHAGHQPAPKLLVCTDTSAGVDLLEAAADLLDPAWVVGMSRHDGTDLRDHHEADLARHRCNLPASLAKPVAGAALAARLDASPVTAPPQVPQALQSDAELAALVHVLVVEDDPLNQAIVTRLLRHAGCRVSTADDGLQALALLGENQHDGLGSPPVDLVLMDWHMPGMDGLEVTRRLRAGAAGTAASRLPIVALTANAFAEDRAACLAAGMDDFLTKPVLAQTLLATVARWADRPMAAPRMPALPATPPQGPVALPAYDPGVLLALPMVVDGSQPGCVTEVLEIFNTGLADLLETLPRRIAQGEAEPVRRALHSLKSSAASVGALALAALAAEVEALLHDSAAQTAASVLASPTLQALPGRLCEASARWHLALACSAAVAPPPRAAPTAAPGRSATTATRQQAEALTC